MFVFTGQKWPVFFHVCVPIEDMEKEREEREENICWEEDGSFHNANITGNLIGISLLAV